MPQMINDLTMGRIEFSPNEKVIERVDLESLRKMVPFTPIPMVLHCPSCKFQHIDKPDPLTGWMNPPHKSHLCKACNTIWRPADVPTTGVKWVSRGKDDNWPR